MLSQLNKELLIILYCTVGERDEKYFKLLISGANAEKVNK